MSNFNKFMRSSAALYRSQERAQQRRTREAARQYKIQQKEKEIVAATDAVEQYNEYVTVIKSMHKDATEKIDWQAMLNEAPPSAPARTDTHEKTAQQKLSTYTPSFLDKIFGSGPKKIKRLKQQVELAIQKDDAAHAQHLKKFEDQKEEYEFIQVTARGIAERDTQAYSDAIEYFEPYSDIAELGSNITLDFRPDHITLNLQVNSADVIPDYVLSQTSTGKLSKKKMPVSKFNELYQDYVCSGILRVARETLAYLPVSYVVVNACGNLFDSATGHQGEKTIVSVVITPEKLSVLNFDTLDPSDSMKNFHHQMQFSKSGGFSAVSPINAMALIN